LFHITSRSSTSISLKLAQIHVSLPISELSVQTGNAYTEGLHGRKRELEVHVEEMLAYSTELKYHLQETTTFIIIIIIIIIIIVIIIIIIIIIIIALRSSLRSPDQVTNYLVWVK